MKPILITGYVNPDIDAIAGTIAYCEFLQKTGKSAEVGILGEMHDEAKYVLDRFSFEYPQIILNSNNFNEVVLIDTSDLSGVEGNIELEKVIEIIDHRTIHEADKFSNAKVQIELVGSASTLIAERFIQSSVEISKKSAILLLSAIISNTSNFKGGVTTDRDRKVANYLNSIAKLPDNFWRELFEAKSDLSGEKLLNTIIGDLASYFIGNKKFSIAQIEMIGADKLIKERNNEIVEILDKVKKETNLDFIFLSVIDLEKEKTYLISNDEITKDLIRKILKVNFNGDIAERDGIIMRKQISPLLKEELEKIK